MHDLDDMKAAKEIAGMAYDAAYCGKHDTADRLWDEVEGLLGTAHTSEAQPEADSDAPTPEKRICIDCNEEGHYRVSIEEGPMGSTVTFKHAMEALRTVYDALKD